MSVSLSADNLSFALVVTVIVLLVVIGRRAA